MATATITIRPQAIATSFQPHCLASRIDDDDTQYPGIKARFSVEDYLLREARLAATKSQSKLLPPGYPQKFEFPSAWSPETLNLEDITYRASDCDIKELRDALEQFHSSGKELNAISPSTFHLPSLGPKLRKLSLDLHEGKGAIIIKGLQPDSFSLKQNIILFAGLSSYIGDQRGRQSAKNDVLTHLYSTYDKSITDPRPGLSNHSLPFHNDHCDILALFVMESALAGGTTRWSSFGQIYNEIVKTKPQVIQVLAKNNWPHETPTKAIKNLPLMFIDDNGLPFVSFTRFALTGLPTYPRSPDSPQLTPEQADALDTIQYLATKNAVEVAQEKGDIFLINNRTVLHARDRIMDPPGESKRHLMRLCLRDTEYGRPIPDDLKRRWGDIFDSNQHNTGQWMLSKEHDASFVSNQKFDAAFPNDETTGSHG